MFGNAESIDDDLGRRAAVADQHLGSTCGQHDERIDRREHRALAPHVAHDEIGHPEGCARRAWHPADHRAGRRRHVRERRRNGCGRPAVLERTRGTPLHVDDAVAERAALEHERAALTHEPEAARMRRDDDAAARVLRGEHFRQAEAGDKRVEMNDVGPLVGEPSMKVVGASNDTALRFVARGERRNRITKHLAAVVLVQPGRGDLRIGRSDDHLMPASAKLAGE